MNIRTPDYFTNFTCLAGACPNTCCKGWSIVVDDASYTRYQAISGKLGAQIQAAIIEKDNEHLFRCRDDGHCVLLDKDGLCTIQRALGAEALCSVCGFYPRFSTEIGANREMGLTISCPEAATLILDHPAPVSFHTVQTQEPVSILHEIDADYYFMLKKARDLAIAIAQKRQHTLPARAGVLLQFSKQLHHSLRHFSVRKPQQILQNYQVFPDLPSNQSARSYADLAVSFFKKLEELNALGNDWTHFLTACQRQLEQLTQTQQLDAQWLVFQQEALQWQTEEEQLLVYFLNKYVIRAAFDQDLTGAFRFSIAGWLYWRLLVFLTWSKQQAITKPERFQLASQYATQVEHAQENCDALFHLLKKIPEKTFLCLINPV